MIILIILVALVVFFVLLYFIEPALIALIFSGMLSLFVRNPPYIDIEDEFPESKLLKDNWKTIRKELDVVLANIDNIPQLHEIDSLQRSVAAKDGKIWKTFIIKGFNEWLEHNCAQVPETTALIRQIPRASLAMFSIMEPGKHIPPHYGFYKSVFRYHLGMIIPENKGDCYLVVNNEKYSWKEGEDVLFDDTYKHEAYNGTDERRVVLFLDVLREKGLPKFMQAINKWVFKLLTNSRQLQKAAKKAEVTQDTK